MSKPRAIIVDIDGTLALRGDRGPFEYDKCGEDPPNWPIIELVKAYKKATGCAVLAVSGREAICIDLTRDWLFRYGVPVDALFMRAVKDYRKDSFIKWELYEEQIKPHFDVDFVLDDRDQVVRLWRSIGLTCLQVAEGNF